MRPLSSFVLSLLFSFFATSAWAASEEAEAPANEGAASAGRDEAQPAKRPAQTTQSTPSDDAPLFELEQIVVVGSRIETHRAEAPVDTLLITRPEIVRSGAKDVADLLQSQPGVEIVRSSVSGAGLRIQGLEGQHVLVLVDGQRVPGRTRGHVDLSRYSTDRVSSIEIVRGAASSLYGSDAMGGVINIVTKRNATKPLEATAQMRADTSSGYELRASAGTASERSQFRLGGGFLRSEAFRLDMGSIETSGSDRNDFDLDLRAEHVFSENFRLVGTAGYLVVDRASVDRGAGGAIFDRIDRTETYTAALTPFFTLGEGHSLRLNLHFSSLGNQLLQDQRGSSALDQYQRTGEDLWEASAIHDIRLGDHRLTSGAEVIFEQLESPRLEGGSGKRIRPALFAQDDWIIADGPLVAITPGLRLDHDSDFGSQLSPKISSRFEPTESLLIRASYAWGFRAASFQELFLRFDNPTVGYRVEGNPALRPETSRGLSANIGYTPIDQLSLDLGVFRNDLENLIASVTIQPGGPGATERLGYQNVEAARTQGAEASVRFRPTKAWTFDTGYTFTDARNLSEDQPLEGRPKHRATLALSWRLQESGTSLHLRGEWVGARPFISLETGAMHDASPYTFASIRISQELGSKLTLFAGGENLFDAGDPVDLMIAPRSFYAGIIAGY